MSRNKQLLKVPQPSQNVFCPTGTTDQNQDSKLFVVVVIVLSGLTSVSLKWYRQRIEVEENVPFDPPS